MIRSILIFKGVSVPILERADHPLLLIIDGLLSVPGLLLELSQLVVVLPVLLFEILQFSQLLQLLFVDDLSVFACRILKSIMLRCKAWVH